MEKTNSRKINLTQKLGVGKGNFKKAIRDGLLLEHSDKDAYDVALNYFENKCAYCGMHEPIVQLTADHIVPSKLGGRFVRGNIIPACQKCNSHRRDLQIQEFITDPNILKRIIDFQNDYLERDQSSCLEEELGKDGVMILNSLDEALIIMRDVARGSIRAYGNHEEVQLKEWVTEFKCLCERYGLI
ncbi:MAG: HNH endonuclease [Lachnospiraceae bacterium]|nr:HNH endonuclease [Lachnospiraceae bacterium]